MNCQFRRNTLQALIKRIGEKSIGWIFKRLDKILEIVNLTNNNSASQLTISIIEEQQLTNIAI
jgi:hypothetical protein